jgi:hypothetical protein
MKRRFDGSLMALAVLAAQASTVTAPAADFTCQVYGGSFVLDDGAFKALAPRGITKEIFASLEAASVRRESACETRMLWRLIRDGKAEQCDLTVHYKNFAIAYFHSSELPQVSEFLNHPRFGAKCP